MFYIIIIGGFSIDRLLRSLLSGYPNEVDFSFNIVTILSHSGGGVTSEPRLLSVMLAHVGLFSEGDYTAYCESFIIIMYINVCF